MPNSDQKSDSVYRAHFTAGGLLYEETLRLLPLLTKPDFPELSVKEVDDNELMLLNARSSRKRFMLELRRRWHRVPDGFYDFFAQQQEAEQRLLLFYGCLKTYPLVFDIHFLVSVQRVKRMLPSVGKQEILFGFDKLAGTHPEIDTWSEKTLNILASNYLYMLNEARLRVDSELSKAVVNPSIFNYFNEQDDDWMREAALHF